MPEIFWTGKLSPLIKIMVNINNILAWIVGNNRDVVGMKKRMKLGYEGACSNHIAMYDAMGLEHYAKITAELFKDIDFRHKNVLDVGCGTGISSFLVLQQGAEKIVCGDFSKYMLEQCRIKTISKKCDNISFLQLDAELLPFNDNCFDAVVSGMMLGLVPNQIKVVTEMVRVLRPGGIFAISTHGPAHYMEAINTAFRAIDKRYIIGYRLEFWPLSKTDILSMLSIVGLSDIRVNILSWQDKFETGGDAYDFFASTSSSWWQAKFPAGKRIQESKKIRIFFKRKKVNQITSEVIFAYGQKS